MCKRIRKLKETRDEGKRPWEDTQLEAITSNQKDIGTQGSSRFTLVPEYHDPGNQSKLSHDTNFMPHFPISCYKVYIESIINKVYT